ncbi:MAG: T9SS type A sorting domain-containing protein [Flavobacteriales bacterium]|nr:T9SS type A sorting domain-containing protein [Flavobacteriales bacterium]
MKKLIPFFVLGTIASANAQVVIDQADFAGVGDVITFGDDADISDDTLTFDMGSTGSGQTFDCSTLETDDLFDVGFYDPSTVQGGSSFPTADVAVDQIGGIYAFTSVGAGSVEVIGLGGDFAGQLGSPIPIEVALVAQDPWTLFEFPASVNSPVLMDTAHFEGKFFSDGLVPAQFASFWDPDSVQVKRIVYYEAEIVGDGTLTDALGGTHNVLKMEVVETSIDTLWGWTASNGWERPPSFVEGLIGVPSNVTVYRTRFVSKELGYYVADITTEANGTPISATHKSGQSQCCTGVEEIVAAGQNVIYPNPTTDFIRVRTGGDIYEFNVYDMTGKLLVTELLTIDGQSVSLNGLSTGLYVFQMVDEAGKVAHTSRLSVIK